MNKVVAAFDFDGTITTRDTMIEFLRYLYGDFKFGIGFLWNTPTLLLYMAKKIDGKTAKERVFRYFLGGMPAKELEELGKKFTDDVINPKLLLPKAMERLKWHQEQGHDCYLVTASLSFWTAPWAEQHGLTLVSSIPEIQNGIFTGKLQGPNCNKREKVKRLEAVLPQKPDYSYAYGNTQGDRALLEWADEGFFREFEK